MESIPTTPLLILSGIIGLIMGSFLSMLTWRLPRLLMNEEAHLLKKLSVGGSKCPSCGQRIPWYKLFPILSWLASGGKCHACDAKISVRYPLIELASATTTVIAMWKFGLTPQGVAAVTLSWFLIAIVVIDWEHQLILDLLSLPLLWLGLLLNTQSIFTSPTEAIWGAAVGYLILWVVFQLFKMVTGKEGMGYGDFKLLAALGAWFGFIAIPQIILIAALSSIVLALIGMALKQRDKNTPMAFGPFLAIAGWVALFVGPNIL